CSLFSHSLPMKLQQRRILLPTLWNECSGHLNCHQQSAMKDSTHFTTSTSLRPCHCCGCQAESSYHCSHTHLPRRYTKRPTIGCIRTRHIVQHSRRTVATSLKIL